MISAPPRLPHRINAPTSADAKNPCDGASIAWRPPHPFQRRRKTIAAIAALLCGTCAWYYATPASAHDFPVAIEGRKIGITTFGGVDRQRFRFNTAGQLGVGVGHDPRVVPTWLVVRGSGPNGGGTGKIMLDPSKWTTLGKPTRPRGYRYRSSDGTEGGITKILLKPGKLSIGGGGAGWPWQPSGPQDSVGVYFGIDNETWCASFGGKIKRNDFGSFQAKGADAPAACPDAICGNGLVEIGEDCDDGNLVETDGCTSDCTLEE